MQYIENLLADFQSGDPITNRFWQYAVVPHDLTKKQASELIAYLDMPNNHRFAKLLKAMDFGKKANRFMNWLQTEAPKLPVEKTDTKSKIIRQYDEWLRENMPYKSIDLPEWMDKDELANGCQRIVTRAVDWYISDGKLYVEEEMYAWLRMYISGLEMGKAAE
jgi:hypothetical protein